MNRRSFLSLIAVSAIAPLLRPSQPALAQQLSLDSDDIYWLVSRAWLSMIADAEGTLKLGTDAYRCIYRYHRFDSFADHPRRCYPIPADPRRRCSDASGAYQIISTTWDQCRVDHPDIWLTEEPAFSPANQDRAALALSYDAGGSAVLLSGAKVLNGHLTVSHAAWAKAVYRDSIEWASLPGHDIGADSGQHTRGLDWLWESFQWALWGECGYYRRISKPLPSIEVTSHYGPRWGAMHKGIDLRAPVGMPVLSTEPATVIKIGRDTRAGLHIVVSPAGYPELQISYCHLSKAYPQRGDTLRQGEIIGESGESGRVTGPHLHLGLWVDGIPINPYRYLMMSEWF